MVGQREREKKQKNRTAANLISDQIQKFSNKKPCMLLYKHYKVITAHYSELYMNTKLAPKTSGKLALHCSIQSVGL